MSNEQNQKRVRERKARVTAVGNVHECCDEDEKRDDNLNTPTHTKN